MIDLRYLVITIVSVFLALAVGIVLGAGPLQQTSDDAAQVQTLRADLAEADRVGQAGQQYAEAVQPAVLDGLLSDDKVAVEELDGATPATVEQLTGALEQAGAEIVKADDARAIVAVCGASTPAEQESELTGQGKPVILACDGTSEDTPLLKSVRADKPQGVSSVDSVTEPMGRGATALAVRAGLDGAATHSGIGDDADAAVPSTDS